MKVQEALLNNVCSIAKVEEPRSPATEKIHSLTQAYLCSQKRPR